jgi:hypothetical protein
MAKWKIGLVVVAVLVALVVSFLAGQVYLMRKIVAHEQAQVGVRGVPSNFCAACQEYSWEWMCWLSGCPPPAP